MSINMTNISANKIVDKTESVKLCPHCGDAPSESLFGADAYFCFCIRCEAPNYIPRDEWNNAWAHKRIAELVTKCHQLEEWKNNNNKEILELRSENEALKKERYAAFQDLIEKEREKEALLKVALDQRDAAIKENAELKRWRDAYRELAINMDGGYQPKADERVDEQAAKILQERGK